MILVFDKYPPFWSMSSKLEATLLSLLRLYNITKKCIYISTP